MKTQMKSFAMLALICAAFTGHASETRSSGRESNNPIPDPGKKTVTLIQPENLNFPLFTKKEGKVYLSLLNTDHSKVSVVISDCQGRLIYHSVERKGQRVERVFNFEASGPDRYTIMVRDGEERHYGKVLVN